MATKRGQRATLRRRELDRITNAVREVPMTAPRHGWISDIRASLGMTAQQLARKLNVDPSVVTRLEHSEAKRKITLSSLDRAAAALGCRVVYALVPDEPFEDIIRGRALAASRRLRNSVAHSMALEDQSLDRQAADDREKLMAEELIAKLDPEIWSKDS